MTEASANPNQLVRGRLLARNVIWNLLGSVAPLLVAVPAVPRLIHTMGADRFGVLTLVWVVIGYAGLFDLGLGRALTQLVAKKLGAGEESEVPALVWTSLAIILILGCFGGVLSAISTSWLVRTALRIPLALQRETLGAFFVLSAAIPVVIAGVALRGILEAYQRFIEISVLRTLLGVLMFGAPLLALPFSRTLLSAAIALAVSRIAICIVSLIFCLRAVPELRRALQINFRFIPSLIRFGFWMTISNAVSSVLTYSDRFVIGATLSVTAVAYYSAPYDFVTKALVIPGAIATVMFPALSTSFSLNHANTNRLFERGAKFACLALFPFALITVTLARTGLGFWLGPEFAKNSTVALQWLTVGVFINGLAQVPCAQVQAAGRPDLTAKINMAEVPVYLFLLWFLAQRLGIVGAAMAWTCRVSVDCLLMFVAARKLLPASRAGVRRILGGCATAIGLLALGAVPMPLSLTLIFLIAIGVVFGIATWRLFLTASEKALVWQLRRLWLASD